MLKGLDCSAWNGDITSALAGCSFAAIRASIGDQTDAEYLSHYLEARKRRVPVIAYHYLLSPGPGPTRQALTLLRESGPANAFALDIESSALRHPDTGKAFIIDLRKADPHKRLIGLYSSQGTWPGDLGQDFNWVADWSQQPEIPWDIWQNASRGLDWDLTTENFMRRLLGVK